MMYLPFRNGSELPEYFRKANAIVKSGGLDYGYLIKYDNAYLKVYDIANLDRYKGQTEYDYEISMYRYHCQYPCYTILVKLRDLRTFATNFENRL